MQSSPDNNSYKSNYKIIKIKKYMSFKFDTFQGCLLGRGVWYFLDCFVLRPFSSFAPGLLLTS